MHRRLLLEIGIEELPPLLVKGILAQLKENSERLFVSSRLDYERILTFGSSRRLVLWVEKLAERQKDKVDEEMGPPKKVVLEENNNLTPDGERYIKAKGVKEEDIGIKKLEKGEYVYIKRRTKGKDTLNVLPSLFIELINSLHFSRAMRWGEGDFYFGRPIRSILALFGKEVVQFEIAGVTSGRKTEGHHYLSPSPMSIDEAEEYFSLLRENWVIVDPEERRSFILRQINKIISSLKEKGYQAMVAEDEELLEEVTYLVEYPTLFLGEFDHQFLHLPSPVLRACLRDYQKHFSVVDENERALPYFLGVREGDNRYLKGVVEGNQRVLNARLTDAIFFLEEDKKSPLREKVTSLKEIVVHKKLGSYYDKTLRLTQLGESFALFLKKDEDVKRRVKEAAYLCKADLLTQIVKEFPNLQGIMGKEYALYSGEEPLVAEAIFEHRLPRISGDRLPQTEEGAILALIDKIDTLVGSFWAGLTPSGSEDPWGLRREAQGVVDIIVNREWRISLDYLIKECLKVYKIDDENVSSSLKEFFKARVANLLKDRGTETNQIKAVLKIGFDDINDTLKRGEALQKVSRRKEFKDEVIAIVRLLNILKQAKRWSINIPEKTEENLLITEEEKALYRLWEKIEKEVEELLDEQEYIKAYERVSTLKDAIHNFFEGVLVMDENRNLRANRLSLLNNIGKIFTWIADFAELQVK
ncbi:MAG: glycine--tRNA ligase subunit beta [Candidatus Aerophobetes bacterium]|nr:glycine--tRNA ligase subunit beta [Candidatus Aerophobetes bacterium]